MKGTTAICQGGSTEHGRLFRTAPVVDRPPCIGLSSTSGFAVRPCRAIGGGQGWSAWQCKGQSCVFVQSRCRCSNSAALQEVLLRARWWRA